MDLKIKDFQGSRVSADFEQTLRAIVSTILKGYTAQIGSREKDQGRLEQDIASDLARACTCCWELAKRSAKLTIKELS